LSSLELDKKLQEQAPGSKKVVEEILRRKMHADLPLPSIAKLLTPVGNTLGFVLTKTTQRNVGLMQQVIFEGGKQFLCLEGETGVGKTATVMYIAEIAGCKTTRLNCSAATTAQQLFGRTVSKNDDHNILGFQFEFGPLLDAWVRGHWVLLDELNLLRPSVQQQIEQLLREESLPLHNFCNLGSESSGTDSILRRSPNFCLFATQNPSGDKYQRTALDSNLSTLLHRVPFEPLNKEDLLFIGNQKLNKCAPLVKFLVEWHLDLLRLSREAQKTVTTGSPEDSILEVTVRDYLSVIEAVQSLSRTVSPSDLATSPLLSDVLEAIYFQRFPADKLPPKKLPCESPSLDKIQIAVDYTSNELVVGNWRLPRKPLIFSPDLSPEAKKLVLETCSILHSADFMDGHGLYMCQTWFQEFTNLASSGSLSNAWRLIYLAKSEDASRPRMLMQIFGKQK
jgi:hypothetical protein